MRQARRGRDPGGSHPSRPPDAAPHAAPDAVLDGAWWSRPAEEVAAALGTPAGGLSSAEARRRAALAPRPRRAAPLWAGPVLAQLRSPLLLVLAGSAGLSFALGEVTDGSIILVLLGLGSLVGGWQEWRASRAAADLLDRVRRTVRVRRDGAEARVPVEEVVPGDLLLLRAGDLVAADARLLDAQDLFAVEAELTGEAYPAAKAPGPVPADAPLARRAGAVWAGTSIRSGTGTAVAVRTGAGTVFGSVALTLERREAETAFTRGLRRFGALVSEVMLAIVLVVHVANVLLGRPFLDSLTFALALAVGMTPQLLPAVLGLTLAAGARALAASGAIVKRMTAVENLGSVDLLCVDKTGTLTEGRVRLVRAVDAEGRESAEVLALAAANAALQQGLANPLDAAVLAAAGPLRHPGERLAERPYDFSRRRLTVVVAEGQGALAITKGAAAAVLEACGPAGTAGAAERAQAWGGEGLRVLAVATRALPRAEAAGPSCEEGMTLRGFLLFDDPPRADAAALVARLAARGVRVVMITGDAPGVAAHVARAVGLPDAPPVAGAQVAEAGADALARVARGASVFAEVDPIGKERLVAAFQAAGHVVGYMGDGINDATALRLADVGLSVEGAVDVARDAADVILTTPDLGLVLAAIDRGRGAFASTMAYVHLAVSANFGNMLSMAAASVVLPFLPLTAGQILLANLLSDLPALTLAGDRPDPAALARPQAWSMARVLRAMLVFGLVSTAFDLMTFALLLGGLGAGEGLFRSGWFLESLLTEILFLFVIRTKGPVWRGRPGPALVGTSLAAAALTLALTAWPPAAARLGFAPMTLPLLAAVAGLALLYAGVSEAAKAILRRVGPAA